MIAGEREPHPAKDMDMDGIDRKGDGFARIDDAENIGSNPSREPAIGEIVARRLGRRDALRALGAGTAAAALAQTGVLGATAAFAQAGGPSSFTFKEIAHFLDEKDHLPEGYESQVLIRWGDKVVADAPPFDVKKQTAKAQALQFGYNCDFVGYLPLPAGSANSENGLLFVNHEYVNSNLMFAGLGAGRTASLDTTKEQSEIEIEAHGATIVEIRKAGGRWQVVENSRYNRRITGTTPIAISGPAAGHARLKTVADPTGTKVLGMLNNCAGGTTPWGTVLTAEENFNGYFGGDAGTMPDAEMHKRYGISKNAWYSWPKHHARFDVTKEPNEVNRFGWMVEIDPFDPASVPVKRTALGRFKHEGAHCVVDKSGSVVAYMGDDERGDYVYKFVSRGKYDPANRAANMRLLDDGTLYVAQFKDDGKLVWLPLVHGQGPLTEANGFKDQAEVLIYARKAADLLKATPMDRPEDVEPNPVTGSIFVILTNNASRKPDQVDKANPRANNQHGHILEIVPPGGSGKDADHVASEATWRIFLLAGKPGVDAGASYHRATSEHGWLSCPDNCAFDAKGRIVIATDGAPTAAGVADGVYMADVKGPGRALTKLFYQAPTGAEVCGPCLTPDDRTLFLAIQHPGEDPGSTIETPSTRWPDFKPDMPPRPSVIAIVRKDGGTIGS
jgi:secreted PhoX family phosphatase